MLYEGVKYTYNVSDEQALTLLFAIGIPILIVSLLFALAFYCVSSYFLMQLFAKANVPGWKAWVPVVNSWKFLELGGYPGWVALLTFVPFFGSIAVAVVSILSAYQIGLKNGKEGVWVVLYLFIGIVWTGMLGLGSSQWNDSLGKPALGSERPPTSGAGTGGYGAGSGGYGAGSGGYGANPNGTGSYNAGPGGGTGGYGQPTAQASYGAPQQPAYQQAAPPEPSGQPGGQPYSSSVNQPYSAPVGQPIPAQQPFAQPVPPAAPGYQPPGYQSAPVQPGTPPPPYGTPQ